MSCRRQEISGAHQVNRCYGIPTAQIAISFPGGATSRSRNCPLPCYAPGAPITQRGLYVNEAYAARRPPQPTINPELPTAQIALTLPTGASNAYPSNYPGTPYPNNVATTGAAFPSQPTAQPFGQQMVGVGASNSWTVAGPEGAQRGVVPDCPRTLEAASVCMGSRQQQLYCLCGGCTSGSTCGGGHQIPSQWAQQPQTTPNVSEQGAVMHPEAAPAQQQQQPTRQNKCVPGCVPAQHHQQCPYSTPRTTCAMGGDYNKVGPASKAQAEPLAGTWTIPEAMEEIDSDERDARVPAQQPHPVHEDPPTQSPHSFFPSIASGVSAAPSPQPTEGSYIHPTNQESHDATESLDDVPLGSVHPEFGKRVSCNTQEGRSVCDSIEPTASYMASQTSGVTFCAGKNALCSGAGVHGTYYNRDITEIQEEPPVMTPSGPTPVTAQSRNGVRDSFFGGEPKARLSGLPPSMQMERGTVINDPYQLRFSSVFEDPPDLVALPSMDTQRKTLESEHTSHMESSVIQTSQPEGVILPPSMEEDRLTVIPDPYNLGIHSEAVIPEELTLPPSLETERGTIVDASMLFNRESLASVAPSRTTSILKTSKQYPPSCQRVRNADVGVDNAPASLVCPFPECPVADIPSVAGPVPATGECLKNRCYSELGHGCFYEGHGTGFPEDPGVPGTSGIGHAEVDLNDVAEKMDMPPENNGVDMEGDEGQSNGIDIDALVENASKIMDAATEQSGRMMNAARTSLSAVAAASLMGIDTMQQVRHSIQKLIQPSGNQTEDVSPRCTKPAVCKTKRFCVEKRRADIPHDDEIERKRSRIDTSPVETTSPGANEMISMAWKDTPTEISSPKNTTKDALTINVVATQPKGKPEYVSKFTSIDGTKNMSKTGCSNKMNRRGRFCSLKPSKRFHPCLNFSRHERMAPCQNNAPKPCQFHQNHTTRQNGEPNADSQGLGAVQSNGSSKRNNLCDSYLMKRRLQPCPGFNKRNGNADRPPAQRCSEHSHTFEKNHCENNGERKPQAGGGAPTEPGRKNDGHVPIVPLYQSFVFHELSEPATTDMVKHHPTKAPQRQLKRWMTQTYLKEQVIPSFQNVVDEQVAMVNTEKKRGTNQHRPNHIPHAHFSQSYVRPQHFSPKYRDTKKTAMLKWKRRLNGDFHKGTIRRANHIKPCYDVTSKRTNRDVPEVNAESNPHPSARTQASQTKNTKRTTNPPQNQNILPFTYHPYATTPHNPWLAIPFMCPGIVPPINRASCSSRMQPDADSFMSEIAKFYCADDGKDTEDLAQYHHGTYPFFFTQNNSTISCNKPCRHERTIKTEKCPCDECSQSGVQIGTQIQRHPRTESASNSLCNLAAKGTSTDTSSRSTMSDPRKSSPTLKCGNISFDKIKKKHSELCSILSSCDEKSRFTGDKKVNDSVRSGKNKKTGRVSPQYNKHNKGKSKSFGSQYSMSQDTTDNFEISSETSQVIRELFFDSPTLTSGSHFEEIAAVRALKSTDDDSSSGCTRNTCSWYTLHTCKEKHSNVMNKLSPEKIDIHTDKQDGDHISKIIPGKKTLDTLLNFSDYVAIQPCKEGNVCSNCSTESSSEGRGSSDNKNGSVGGNSVDTGRMVCESNATMNATTSQGEQKPQLQRGDFHPPLLGETPVSQSEQVVRVHEGSDGSKKRGSMGDNASSYDRGFRLEAGNKTSNGQKIGSPSSKRSISFRNGSPKKECTHKKCSCHESTDTITKSPQRGSGKKMKPRDSPKAHRQVANKPIIVLPKPIPGSKSDSNDKNNNIGTTPAPFRAANKSTLGTMEKKPEYKDPKNKINCSLSVLTTAEEFKKKSPPNALHLMSGESNFPKAMAYVPKKLEKVMSQKLKDTKQQIIESTCTQTTLSRMNNDQVKGGIESKEEKLSLNVATNTKPFSVSQISIGDDQRTTISLQAGSSILVQLDRSLWAEPSQRHEEKQISGGDNAPVKTLGNIESTEKKGCMPPKLCQSPTRSTQSDRKTNAQDRPNTKNANTVQVVSSEPSKTNGERSKTCKFDLKAKLNENICHAPKSKIATQLRNSLKNFALLREQLLRRRPSNRFPYSQGCWNRVQANDSHNKTIKSYPRTKIERSTFRLSQSSQTPEDELTQNVIALESDSDDIEGKHSNEECHSPRAHFIFSGCEEKNFSSLKNPLPFWSYKPQPAFLPPETSLKNSVNLERISSKPEISFLEFSPKATPPSSTMNVKTQTRSQHRHDHRSRSYSGSRKSSRDRSRHRSRTPSQRRATERSGIKFQTPMPSRHSPSRRQTSASRSHSRENSKYADRHEKYHQTCRHHRIDDSGSKSSRNLQGPQSTGCLRKKRPSHSRSPAQSKSPPTSKQRLRFQDQSPSSRHVQRVKGPHSNAIRKSGVDLSSPSVSSQVHSGTAMNPPFLTLSCPFTAIPEKEDKKKKKSVMYTLQYSSRLVDRTRPTARQTHPSQKEQLSEADAGYIADDSDDVVVEERAVMRFGAETWVGGRGGNPRGAPDHRTASRPPRPDIEAALWQGMGYCVQEKTERSHFVQRHRRPLEGHEAPAEPSKSWAWMGVESRLAPPPTR